MSLHSSIVETAYKAVRTINFPSSHGVMNELGMEGGTALTRVMRTALTLGPEPAGCVVGGMCSQALTRLSWEVPRADQDWSGSHVINRGEGGGREALRSLRSASCRPCRCQKGCVLYLEFNRKPLERFRISRILEKSLRLICGQTIGRDCGWRWW